MKDWFKEIESGCELPERALQELLDSGFVVIPGPVANERLAQFAQAYDLAVAGAVPPDLSVGSTNTRVHDFVNRNAEFDELYIYRPVLEACCRIIGQPYKLSSLLARTVRPHSQAQVLHVDFRADAEGWPMVGFIFMVDDFRVDNGATRFVPGSHKWPTIPGEVMKDPASDYECQVVACGAAGSVIIYNGSVWHGHTANRSGESRRSVQGAYIRRGAEPWVNWAERIVPQTRARICPLAEYLLAV
jgi:ectoine hydroxylase-related dioxygenase (phytanoyl-CoA dioxygenase family)